ncbi:MAG TPA: adenylate/guanylate cyclase domain-containing protein [Usitatibacter sp.]|nr:adenylate/guanylate cyclase domain-containing protein [Usitatibacter sp.]
MSASWERLRHSKARKGALLFALACGLAAALALLPSPKLSPLADAERAMFDVQMRVLREYHPRPLARDVVLIGIDEDTYAAYDEPFALWHRHSEEMLRALARAKPRAVGVDMVLPERSFNAILPGADFAIMRGLVALKHVAPLVYVQTLSDKGRPVPIQQNFRGILAPDNLGLDQQEIDPDLTSRHFDESVQVLPTLAGQLLRHLGIEPQRGFIDYSVGAPLDYVPMHTVGKMGDAELQARFGDRIVFVGSVIGDVDRWRLPARLMAHDPGRGRSPNDQPGVLIHAQVVRSHLGAGLLSPVPEPLKWLAIALAALAVLVAASPLAVVGLAVIVPFALFGLSLASIVSAQTLLPLAPVVVTFWIALLVRGIFDAIEAVVDRIRLQKNFAGQVSPAVMKEMLGGNLSPGGSGQLAEVCVLFSDVRDFTTLSENMPPQVVTTVLQRYFDRMVHAVHRYDGTVDKFIGDGMMVLFGAPLKSKDPCGDAVQCALGMMMALDSLNEEFRREGLPVLTIGIGINYGTVTVGYIGSSERHNYSAIGDAVNVAARVEGLTKELGRKIIITEAVVSRIEERFHFDPLGTHKVKGHSPVNVWGIRTARPVASLADTLEVVRS